jgi:neutral amino acid transport system permease protein
MESIAAQVPQLLMNGIALGSVIALSAVGLSLTYGVLRLSNFAHGDYMTLGAYVTWTLNLMGVNIWLAMLLSAVIMVGFALGAEKILWGPMRAKRATPTTLVILSIGLALFLRNGVILAWGADSHQYQLPVESALNLGLVKLPFNNFLVIVLALGAIALLRYILQNTKVGKAMRAVADDVDLARVTGINVERVVLWTWVIAAGLTALGGSMLGLVEAVRPNMGWFLILPLFAAVTLGGIGNPYGAIAGAFVIGIAQEMSTLFLPVEYKTAVALIIMMLVLLVKPQGLFRGMM